MVEFSTIDIVFIIAYVVLVLSVAYARSRKSKEEEFLIAGRKLGIISTLSTINATKTGSIILIFVALLYMYGFSAMWYFIGVSTGYLVFIPFAVRIHKAHGASHYTFADYYFHAYGKIAGSCVSILNIFLMLAWLMLNLIASSKVLSFFTGISFEWAVLTVLLVVLIYLLIGGFKAVVTTDVLQYVAIVFILLIFAIMLLQGVDIPVTEWNIGKAGATNILGFFLLGILIPFASPELWQRVYAVKDTSTLKKGIFYSVVVYIFVAVILALIGLAIKTTFPGIDPDIALVQGFANMLPAGLTGLAVVVFFAAFMSSIDTYTYTAASSLIQDFFKNLTKKQSVRAIKIALTGIIILGGIIAVVVQDLILGAFIFASYSVLLAIPTIATWIKPSINSRTLSIAFIFGVAGLSLLTVFKAMTSGLTPMIVIMAIGLSIIGLLIGAVFSKFTSPNVFK